MKQVRVIKCEHGRYPWEVVAPGSLFGRRIRRRCKTKREANDHKLELEQKLNRSKLAPLTTEVHLVAARYQKKLTADQMDHLLREGLERFAIPENSLCALALRYKEQQEAAFERGAIVKETWNPIRYRLPKLVRWLGDPQVRDIDKKMLTEFEKARRDAGAAPRTIKNYVDQLSAVLNFGIEEGALIKNPVTTFKMGNCKGKVHIMKPEQLKELLPYADNLMLPWIMFGAFGGLRSSEIHRIRWSDVRLGEDQFYVPPRDGRTIGKTANAVRWVQLTPPLRAYCKSMLKDGAKGPVLMGRCSNTIARHQSKLYEAAGLRIPNNALRHSYGSHHLVHYDNPANTATEMGHVTPQQTFDAYRETVLKSQAVEFWKVRAPKK